MDDGDGMDVGTAAEDKKVTALTMAGVAVEKAKIWAASMCKRSPTTTFIQGLWTVDQRPVPVDSPQPQCQRP